MKQINASQHLVAKGPARTNWSIEVSCLPINSSFPIFDCLTILLPRSKYHIRDDHLEMVHFRATATSFPC